MIPNASWPIGFEFMTDVNPDLFTITTDGVQMLDVEMDIEKIIPFGSQKLRELFSGKRIFSEKKLVDCFIDGIPQFHGAR